MGSHGPARADIGHRPKDGDPACPGRRGGRRKLVRGPIPKVSRYTLTHLQTAAMLGVAVLLLALGWSRGVAWPWWAAAGLEPRPWWHLMPLAVAAVGMFAKVRHPVLGLGLGLAAFGADLVLGGSVALVLCLTDLLYSMGIRGSGRALRRVTVLLCVVIGGAGAAVLLLGVGVREMLNVLLIGVAVLLTPLWWAVEVRRGSPLLSEGDARERLERERHAAVLEAQEARRRSAVEEERRRMARELHDVLSSQLSAIALTSGGALHAPPDEERDRRALAAIRAGSLESLEQLRDMVHLLRGPAASEGGGGELLAVATWAGTLERARSHGLDVTESGELPRDLPPMVEGVLVRLLQESLANVLKHGPGEAEVRLETGRGHVRLRISSPVLPAGEGDGADGGDAASPPSSGTGLAAMRERVRLVGGRIRVGRSGGEWVVDARMPRRQGRGTGGDS
jgi:signal transduction histidine kinase